MRILFSRMALRHICHGKNSRLWYDLPISVKDKEFLLSREGFVFAKLRVHENKTLAEISEFTVSLVTI